ncbi:MAG: hypothetical protein ABI895_21885 [Deltaproteobacteria bacterium]
MIKEDAKRFVRRYRVLGLLPAVFWLGACGPAAGTGPHEMSAAQHQSAAAQEQLEAAEHGKDYDPQAQKKQLRCAPGQTKTGICWKELVNSTAEHDELAAKHRKLAAQHRAASQTLVQAEARACAGLDPDDRDMSPFVHGGDIASVSLLKEATHSEGGYDHEGAAIGASIVFQAVPGLTAPWFQHIVDCHLARNAALGHAEASAEMAFCPLTIQGAQATVRESRSGFAVDVRSEAPGGADEIWRVAQKLAPGGR